MPSFFKLIVRPGASLLSQSRTVLPHVSQARFINLDALSNRRITRLESDIELDDCEYKGRMINRNPRNLEQLSFERKPKGYWLEKSPPMSWNKLVLEQNGRYLTAYLQHWSGKKLIEASTREPKLSKYFRSPNTTEAVNVLARVIALRCLQSGYLCMEVDDVSNDTDIGPKTKAFFEIVQTNGITLKETPEIVARSVTDV